ncbi:GNAT family N-acetyltransferase [Epilithonimonas sp.]|uniref:GNAT family N-acetyltransferase n=1 Tax=Epilithonimonas sp. TaxID=2894511 RepID=UPI002FDD5EB0
MCFCCFYKKSNSFAGSTRFYNILSNQKTLEIGYTWYGKNFQGTGLNKNCKYLLLEFAFEKLLIERVGFIADFENKKSIAAMKSIGCKEEGILRSNIFKKDGTRRDSIVLSILKNEWSEDVKQKLNIRII